MRLPRLGLAALGAGAVVIGALPNVSLGLGGSGDATTQGPTLQQTLKGATTAVTQTVAVADATVQQTVQRTTTALSSARQTVQAQAQKAPQPRATTTTPQTDPPLHGTNNHGQGTVAVVDLTPTNQRPVGGNPDGSDAGPEEIVVGRARGEQQADGHYHGHITIAALFGHEVLGVDTPEGQSAHGPLQPVQQNLLDPICNGSAQQVCLSVLTADSSTTTTGSTNDFAVARAQLGGANGIGVGAAESKGTITQDANCQTSTGSAKTANVSAGGGAVANVANSSSSSQSCRGQAPKVTNSSQVIGLGGTNVPIPAPGCANGTPDTVTGIPTLAPIVCNADTVAGAQAVREALDVFVLSAGGTSLVKETTAASESVSTAPAEAAGTPQCSDGVDNDGDGLVDAADPGCHSDNNAGNPSSYNPNDNDESNSAPVGGAGNPTSGKGGHGTPTSGSGGNGTPTNGKGNGNGTPSTNGNGNRPQCSNGVDDDGDGLIDARDPGCHSDGNPNNPASYNPNDNSEANGGPVSAAGALPFTGSDVLVLLIGGLLVAAGGLVLRRRGASLS